MKEESALFDEFYAAKPQKGKLFDVLTVLSSIYIGSILIYLAVDTRFSAKRFGWQIGALLLTLPLLGMLFHLTGKKIGWIINSFYYWFVALIILYTLVWNMLEDNDFHLLAAWRGLVVFVSSLTSAILLLSKSIRRYFTVSTMLLVIVVGCSVGLALIIVVAVLQHTL